MVRLDKFLADAGLGTRSECKKLIKKGLVTVEGIPAASPEQKIDPDNAQVSVEGKPVVYERCVCYLFHKPAGVVTARRDGRDATVMDFFREAPGRELTPVGRLDKDTEGLLLVTNDGALSHHLTSPAHHVEKTYEAILDAALPEDAKERLAAGIDIGDGKLTLPAELVCLPDGPLVIPNSGEKGCVRVSLTIREGRYHQVKRMFAALGCQVLYLKRVSLGGLALGSLARGEYRKLAEEEIKNLRGGSE